MGQKLYVFESHQRRFSGHMKIVKTVLLICILATLSARASLNCQSYFGSPIIPVEGLTEIVKLVWYPKSQYVMLSHVELAVDGQMWDATSGFSKRGTLKSRKRATKSGGYGYFSFSLRVTSEEMAKLQMYLEENLDKRKAQMCISGACRALRKNTGIYIPFPFSKVPTFSAMYLSLGRLIGNKRIERIDYVGKNRLKSLLSLAVANEITSFYSAGYLSYWFIVWFRDEYGDLVNQVIPIILGKNENMPNNSVAVA